MNAPDGLPALRDVIRRYELMAKKSLGQNFLLDFNLLSRIARAGGRLEGVTVIEVGPGPGGLTRALLMEGARHVIAIERDLRCIPALEDIAARHPGRLTIINGDALATDWAALVRDIPSPVRLIANLPYNIATQLLVDWIRQEPWPPWYDGMVLMFQREVAERIVATPIDPESYGRLGVLAGWRLQAEIMFDIPPGAFLPAPSVTSSVVAMVPRATPLPCRVADLERVTQAAFGQRRKMLRQSLRSLGKDTTALLAAAALRPEARAEEVPVESFVRLANAFAAA